MHSYKPVPLMLIMKKIGEVNHFTIPRQTAFVDCFIIVDVRLTYNPREDFVPLTSKQV